MLSQPFFMRRPILIFDQTILPSFLLHSSIHNSNCTQDRSDCSYRNNAPRLLVTITAGEERQQALLLAATGLAR